MSRWSISKRRLDRFVARAAGQLAGSRSASDIASCLLSLLEELLAERDDLVVHEIVDGRYRVLAGTRPGVTGTSGEIDEHPVLPRLPSSDTTHVLREDDPAVIGELRKMLRASRVREITSIPLAADNDVLGGVLVLRRRPLRPAIRTSIEHACAFAADALSRQRLRDEVRAVQIERQRDIERITALITAERNLDTASTPEEVLGHVLQAIRSLDDALIGAVVGVVSGGVVAEVSATGTTPRTAVSDLPGTKLDGFPIGRELLASREPAFADSAATSHATRTRIMDPIGARSLLAAAGRDDGRVRVALSAYRSVADPPNASVLAAIELACDLAAHTLGRFARRDALTATGEAAGVAVLVCDRSGGPIEANELARELLPEVAEGREPAYDDATTGEALDPRTDPIALAYGGTATRDLILRHRSTQRLHRVSALPLSGWGAVVRVEDVTDHVDPDTFEAQGATVTDLIERRGGAG